MAGDGAWIRMPPATARDRSGLRIGAGPVQRELQKRGHAHRPARPRIRLSRAAQGLIYGWEGAGRTEKWEMVLLGGRKWGTVAPSNRPEWRGSPPPPPPVSILLPPPGHE